MHNASISEAFVPETAACISCHGCVLQDDGVDSQKVVLVVRCAHRAPVALQEIPLISIQINAQNSWRLMTPPPERAEAPKEYVHVVDRV